MRPKTVDRSLALDAVRITEAAAMASAKTMGRGDFHAAEEAAATAMRRAFDALDIRGIVRVGEGAPEETPLLYVGEEVGRWHKEDPLVEVAIDPLEGVRLCALGMPNAISVLALAQNGSIFRAPDTYMYKLAVGPAGRGAIDIRRPVSWNLHSVADAMGVYVEDLTVVILDRPRHEGLVREVRDAGARIKLISDGDVAAAVATCRDESPIDLLVGVGGAPEGVLAAAALRCVGGDMAAQLRPRDAEEAEVLRVLGFDDPNQILGIEDLVSGDVLFAATGITDGEFLRGVRFIQGGAVSHSIVMRSETMTVRFIEAEHRFKQSPEI